MGGGRWQLWAQNYASFGYNQESIYSTSIKVVIKTGKNGFSPLDGEFDNLASKDTRGIEQNQMIYGEGLAGLSIQNPKTSHDPPKDRSNLSQTYLIGPTKLDNDVIDLRISETKYERECINI